MRTLLDAGADKNLAQNDGATPLYIAAQEAFPSAPRQYSRARRRAPTHDQAVPAA